MNYRYMRPDGEAIDLDYPMGEAPWSVTMDDGVIAVRDLRRVGVPPTKGWPLECYASGVNAADSQKLRDEFDKVGVPTEVTNDGNPVYTSAKHRKKALKARGFYDRSGY